MMDWDGGMGSGWWPVMVLLWIFLIAVLVWAGTRLVSSRHERPAESVPRESPEQELDRRLARGEIDMATYDEVRERLRAAQADRRTVS